MLNLIKYVNDRIEAKRAEEREFWNNVHEGINEYVNSLSKEQVKAIYTHNMLNQNRHSNVSELRFGVFGN